MPAGFLVTPGVSADRGSAVELIREFDADALLPRRAYDTGEALAEASGRGMEAVIPPKSNRRERRAIGLHLYKQRHLVENAFERIKRWRGLATRYREPLSSLVATVQIRCASLWLHIL